MAEGDSILDSTELNGNILPTTVDPSKLGLQSSSSHARTGQLPFHSPSKSSAYGQLNNQTENGFRATQSSDGVGAFRSTPKGRSSPKVQVAPRPREPALPYATKKTGLVYDPRMRFHAELPSLSDNQDDIHPEDPRRIHSIFEEIRQAGLVGSSSTDDESREAFCWRIAIRMATRAEIRLIHTEAHYDFVESLQGMYIPQSRGIASG